VQTGGYGQLGRSFGLFGDHVRSLQIITYDGQDRTITRASDPDLFWAILGGSPGNFGVVTHFTLEVYRDEDYKGALGMKALFLYDRKKVERMMGIIARMADDGGWARNFDLCASVLSSSFPLGQLAWPGLDTKMKEEMPGVFGEDQVIGWPKTMVVYAQ
jgi:FAD/FMN-containing dehydrogenase